MARRFGFGPGVPPMGPRMFGRGDLKYALMELLNERPKHGYELIKELEEKSGGFYTPSAGAVYPTLQMLEDRGWLSSSSVEGKKVYSLTDAGHAALEEHRKQRSAEGEFMARGPWGWGEHGHKHHHGPFGGPGGPFWREARPELGALRRESMEVARLMRAAVLASGGDPARLERLRGIVERAKAELNQYLGQGGAPSGGSAGEQPVGEGPAENL
jgi:DNA-binding PadR family transcriptional regulator